MALYDVRCTSCKAVERDVVHAALEPPPACRRCGSATEHVWDRGTPRAKFFHKGWYEHLAHDPLYFDDRGKLREYCNQNDLRMDQLE